jgi:nitrogen-specific signal transduction histidine kinase
VRDPVRAVAHDLNNVFAAVLGCADLLAIRLKDQPALAEVTEIQRAAERGARLTKRLFRLRPARAPQRTLGRAARQKKKC